jgi:hypothetical protein
MTNQMITDISLFVASSLTARACGEGRAAKVTAHTYD